MLLGEPEDRARVREFEDFLSQRFFQSRSITLIPYEADTAKGGRDDMTVRIKIGDEPQLPIYELGDGLQNLIICTFNIFMEKDRCLFFIEEPDLYMHPSLQRSFLEVLSEHNQHQYFLTSHSNHLLDMSLDFSNTSIFHFSKPDDDHNRFNIRVASSRDHRVLLDLGVRNSSVLLTNATIWVEGITDRLYLRAYMKKYIDGLKVSDPDIAARLRTLKEDYHYSFVEYQGSTLTHWNFDPDRADVEKIKATFVCAHACLVADGDIESKERAEIYGKMLGERFFLLKVKEIENLMPLEILRIVVADNLRKHGKDANIIKFADYSKKKLGLGEYLDAILEIPAGETEFAARSGTIKSSKKTAFCENAIGVMSEPSVLWSLTPDLTELCKKIFDHILSKN